MKSNDLPTSVIAGAIATAVLVATCIFSSTLKASESAALAPKQVDLIACTKCHSDRALAENVKEKMGNTDPKFVSEYIAMLAELRVERRLPPRKEDFAPASSTIPADHYNYAGNKK
jgi:hypothetical protein